MQFRRDDEEALGTPRPSSPENFFGSTSVFGEAVTLAQGSDKLSFIIVQPVATRTGYKIISLMIGVSPHRR